MSLFEYFILTGIAVCMIGLFLLADTLKRIEREAHMRERYLREKIRELEGKRGEHKLFGPRDTQWTTESSAKPF